MIEKLQFTELTENEKFDIYIKGKTKDEKYLIGNSIIMNRYNIHQRNLDQDMIEDITKQINLIIKNIYTKPIIIKKPNRKNY